MHGRDAGVLQLAGDAGLAEEPPGSGGVEGVALGEELDRAPDGLSTPTPWQVVPSPSA